MKSVRTLMAAPALPAAAGCASGDTTSPAARLAEEGIGGGG